jgi:hypothetical protein
MADRVGEGCGRHVECEAVDSECGPWAVDIAEEGCTQHSRRYPGGMVLLRVTR